MKHCIVGVIVLLLGLAGCSSSQPATVSAAAPSPAPAAKPAAPDYFETSAPLVVENQVDVLALREGVVAEILADVGAPVTRGQLLARLDDRQLRAEYEASQLHVKSLEAQVHNFEAELKVLENDLHRQEELNKAGVASEQQVEHARYELDAERFGYERQKIAMNEDEAKLRSQKIELDKTAVVAPFAGVVARRYVRLGQKVSANDRIFWVTATAPIKVQFTLPEMFAGKIAKGQTIAVLSPATPNVQHEARISAVSPVVDPASGTIDVQAMIESPTADLKPGMTATVRVKKAQ